MMIGLVAFTGQALAQEPDYDRINAIAKNLNCPTCAGLNLADCRTQTCAQWRGQIGDLVQDGYSDQEVLDFFSERYGEQVLQAPPKSGFTLLLWVLPFIAILAAGGWLALAMRNWANSKQTLATGSTAPASPGQPVLTSSDPADDYLRQVDRDLGLGQGLDQT
ncbi:MAG TPA: cytochrome c-type biogenesis protein [Anaerolineae bacterium]